MPLQKAITDITTGETIYIDMSPEEENELIASKQASITQAVIDDDRERIERAKPSLEKRIEALEKALLALIKKGS